MNFPTRIGKDAHLMTQHLLPAMRHISGETFIFQRDSAPAHLARETIELLSRMTPNFIEMWPPNSPDLNPVHYSIWLVWKSAYINSEFRTLMNFGSVW